MLIQYKMIHVFQVQRCHSSHTQKQLDDFLGVVKPYIQIVQTGTFFLLDIILLLYRLEHIPAGEFVHKSQD